MFDFLSRHRIASVVALALLLSLTWTATTARAADTKLQASGIFELVSVRGTHAVFTGEGVDSQYGSFTMTASSHANNGNLKEKAVMSLNFGNGTLTLYIEDVWVPELGARVGTYVITDGTGIFDGATGAGIFSGFPKGDGTGSFSLDFISN